MSPSSSPPAAATESLSPSSSPLAAAEELRSSTTQPFTQHFGIFRNNNKLVYQSQDFMCTNKKGKIGEAYFDHSWYVFFYFYNYFDIAETVWICG